MIKELNKEYLNELVRLHELAFKPLEDIFGKYSSKGVREGFEKHMQEGKVWGYFVKKELVGCISLVVEWEVYGKVQDLAVKPNFQGRGIAKELMGFVQKYAKKNGVKELRVFTRSDNVKNVKIYEKLGFKTFVYTMKKEI